MKHIKNVLFIIAGIIVVSGITALITIIFRK